MHALITIRANGGLRFKEQGLRIRSASVLIHMHVIITTKGNSRPTLRIPARSSLYNEFAIPNNGLTSYEIVRRTNGTLSRQSPYFRLGALTRHVTRSVILNRMQLSLSLVSSKACTYVLRRLIRVIQIRITRTSATSFPLIRMFLRCLPDLLSVSFCKPISRCRISMIHSRINGAFIGQLPRNTTSRFRDIRFHNGRRLSTICSTPTCTFTRLFLISMTLYHISRTRPSLSYVTCSFYNVVLSRRHTSSRLQRFRTIIRFCD